MMYLQADVESVTSPPTLLLKKTLRIYANLTTHSGRGRLGMCPPVPHRGYATELQINYTLLVLAFFTSPLAGCKVLWWVCLSICLFVCLSVWSLT